MFKIILPMIMILALSSSAFADGPTFRHALTSINNCSGAVFKLEDSKPSDKALIVTAGHCAQMGNFEGMPAEGEKFVNLPVNIETEVGTLNPLKNLVRIQATHLLLATMTETDLAIYETDKTYMELNAAKVEVLTLPRLPPTVAAGAAVLVPSVSSFDSVKTTFNRYVDATKEGQYLWKHSLVLNKQHGLGAGASGAAVVLAGTKMIIGIVNTGRDGTDTSCSMSNPCLVDKNGKATPAPISAPIAQPIHQIYDCLTVDRKVDLSLPYCKM